MSSFSTEFSHELVKIYDKSCPFRVLALQISDSFTSVTEILKDFVKNIIKYKLKIFSQNKVINHFASNFKEWFIGFEQLKVSVKGFEEDRRKYDHYSRKIEKLRQGRVQKISKNQAETAKDVEKLQRVFFKNKF